MARPSEGSRLVAFERTPIHPVLYRRPVYLGVPRETLKQELVLFLALLGIGYGSWVAVGFVVALMFVLHGQLVKACRTDVRALDVLLNALQVPDVMARTPSASRPAKSRAYWRAIPRG